MRGKSFLEERRRPLAADGTVRLAAPEHAYRGINLFLKDKVRRPSPNPMPMTSRVFLHG